MKNLSPKNITHGATSNIGLKDLPGVPTNITDALVSFTNAIAEYLTVAEIEHTKRTDIIAKRDIALAEIQSKRDSFSELLKYTFQERAVVLQKQFDALDFAMNSDNVALAQMSLKAMVSTVTSSPFKSVQELQQALGSEDFVVRLE